MQKKDVLELKRRLKKDECTFTRMCGCYVDGDKNKVLKFNETFLSIKDDEFFKYLEIAKKVLSGTIGNNLLNLEFPADEEIPGGKQEFFMRIKASRLKDDLLLDKFYETVINTLDTPDNYLILLFHDAYDVITRTSDNLKLDESEEVYEYILCAICPVTLSKAGLRYFEDDNRIGARIRDWVVELPSLGFVFPAFSERSTDVNSILYYTKNAKEPHAEFMEEGLGCKSKQTTTEQKEIFNTIIKRAIGEDNPKGEDIFMEIQENLNYMVDEHKALSEKDSEPIVLTHNAIEDILLESGVPEEVTNKIKKSYSQEFGEALPPAESLIDPKIIKASEQKKKEQRLEKQVELLQNKLEKTEQVLQAKETDTSMDDDPSSTIEENSDEFNEGENDETIYAETNNEAQNYDIVLHVKPQKVSQIKSEIIDGKKCIIIPVEDNEQTTVNGIDNLI